MNPILQTQFQQEKERLQQEYCPPKNFWSFFKNTTYQSTSEIANTPPYITEQFDDFKTYYTKYTCLFFIPIIIWLVYEVFENRNETSELFNITLLCLGAPLLFTIFGFIQFLLLNLDRKPTISIDRKGIAIRKENFYTTWNNVVDTYIKSKSGKYDNSETLVVHYYDESTQIFKKVEASLNNLKQKSNKIAYAIELMKSKLA